MRACNLAVLALVAGCKPQGGTQPGDEHTTTEPKPQPIATTKTTEEVAMKWPAPATTAPALEGAPTEAGRPRGDRSKTLPGGESSWVSLALPKAVANEGELHGVIESLRRVAGDTPGSVRIAAKDGDVIELAQSGPGTLALAIGDAVALKWRRQTIRIHFVQDLALVGADGRVIYASSGNGDAVFAPGWYVEQKGVHERDKPHMARGARRESHWMLLALGDAAGFVHEGEHARRLDTDAGSYAISGSAIDWSEGLLPPDAGAYQTFSIVRLP